VARVRDVIRFKRGLITAIAALGIAACGGTHHVPSSQTTGTSGLAAKAAQQKAAQQKAAQEAAKEAAILPPPIKPVFPNPLPGEVGWKPTGPLIPGGPPVLVTTFRPELGTPSAVAHVPWSPHTSTQLRYHPRG